MKEYKRHNELIVFLSKRRGQHRKSLGDMVKLSMDFIPKIEDLDTKLAHIKTIRDVCDKKIFLEVEYARCSLMLVKQNETDDNIKAAAEILQNI